MIDFAWDERKARRNEPEHGVSFAIAQAALETQLGVAIEEQHREGEWRTIIIAPFRGILLLHITIAFYGRNEDENIGTEINEQTEQNWIDGEGTIRIISARKATPNEQALYFAARPPSLG